MFQSGGGTDHLSKRKKRIDLDSFYSNKRLGAFFEDGKTVFRLFAPQAKSIVLALFNRPEDHEGPLHKLNKDSCGVWEIILDGELRGVYYGYYVYNQLGKISNKNTPLILDPYAKAITTFTTYKNPRKAILIDEYFDWGNDNYIKPDWRDLIIYELHIRDMSIHPSSGATKPGSYAGLVEKNISGGLNYIKSLGVNTVELMPAMEFGKLEIPFDKKASGKTNTWNPYEQNHWGYMTGAFFAPEAYYSEVHKSLPRDKWIGIEGNQVNEFKNMVKAFHKEGLAVIMDVVFNHLSEYEIGNLKEIDKEYYFRLNEKGEFISESYCGNDLKSERPMVRRLIVESILYWMKEYHIDGFRFDLGKLIDFETIETVYAEARKINPNVIFVCEPWGGGYDPEGFSQRGWGAWNDQIRNGIKGENPVNGLGWIFGQWYGNNNLERIKSYVKGTPIEDQFGLFYKKEHSVNYLESHDGYTLGDFIRIGIGDTEINDKIKDAEKHTRLTQLQLRYNKLAALFLLTSQGITMLHAGQEFARSKIISAQKNIKDKDRAKLDHNSYNKDNDTNYINYTHAEINSDLKNYYTGLINIRNNFEAFRRADEKKICFHELIENKFALAYTLKHEGKTFFVMFNAHKNLTANFSLPDGIWGVLADWQSAGVNYNYTVSTILKVPHTTGAILFKLS